jgi:hypothetical protein
MPSNNQRRRHRKRTSTLKLPSDTTTALPEYIYSWHTEDTSESVLDLPSDKPPDYPDSAEEADEDTDSDGNSSPCVPHSPQVTPRRHRRFPYYTHTHRRKKSAVSTSSNDLYLDSLLARSVHALEMSNTLLQSAQPSVSAVLTSDSPVDTTLERSIRGPFSWVQGNGNVHETLVDNLNEISQGVEALFSGEQEDSRGGRRKINSPIHHLGESSISSSLPTTSSLPQGPRHRRRPSFMDLREVSEHQVSHLHLSLQDRASLVSPPPRALTQFVASTADLDSITLPSTIGLRASASLHPLRGSPSSPRLTDRPPEPSTPAYNMLSSFVYRSSSPCSSASSSFASAIPSLLSSRRNSRNGSNSADRTNAYSPGHAARKSSSDCGRISNGSPTTCRPSRSQTPKQITLTLPRSMTPPTEESSSSDGCPAKRTIQCLRKILDEQPPPPEPPRLRPPAFLPRTPAPVPDAGTSTATASISQLFTKAKHSSSTRPSSPPRQSAMKQLTPNGNGTRTPSNLPFINTSVGSTSAPSSGRSTPKHISFAKLPESYAGSRPEGSSSKFRDRDKKRRRGTSLKDKYREDKNGRDGEGDGGWWTGWLVGASGPHAMGVSALRNEERMEDRLTRNWSGRMGAGFGPTLDDWSI